jgi:hypothetical protein
MKRSIVLKEIHKEITEFINKDLSKLELIVLSDLVLSVTEEYMTPEPHMSRVKLGPGIIIDRIHREWETE